MVSDHHHTLYKGEFKSTAGGHFSQARAGHSSLAPKPNRSELGVQSYFKGIEDGLFDRIFVFGSLLHGRYLLREDLWHGAILRYVCQYNSVVDLRKCLNSSPLLAEEGRRSNPYVTVITKSSTEIAVPLSNKPPSAAEAQLRTSTSLGG